MWQNINESQGETQQKQPSLISKTTGHNSLQRGNHYARGRVSRSPASSVTVKRSFIRKTFNFSVTCTFVNFHVRITLCHTGINFISWIFSKSISGIHQHVSAVSGCKNYSDSDKCLTFATINMKVKVTLLQGNAKVKLQRSLCTLMHMYKLNEWSANSEVFPKTLQQTQHW